MGILGSIFGKKDKPAALLSIRDTLFGDMPLNQWPRKGQPSADIFPWSTFGAAQQKIADKQPAEAILLWHQIADSAGLEPRQYLQAWHFLRTYGEIAPPEIAKQLLGIVIEVMMPNGLDLLAAYPDHSARYYNFSGAGVIWEHPDTSLDSKIDDLLLSSASVVAQIGIWDGDRPDPPPVGQIRMSFLTPSGLHFGQGPFEILQKDPIGGRTVQNATKLMLALVEKSKPGITDGLPT